MNAILGLVLAASLVGPVEAGDDCPAPPDREDEYMEMVERLDLAEDNFGVILAGAAYRKDFPFGRRWLEVAVLEFEASVASLSTMGHAADLYREIRVVLAEDEHQVNLILKTQLGLAFAKYGLVKEAEEKFREVAATRTVRDNPESIEFFDDRLAELAEVGKPFRHFRAAGPGGLLVDTAALRGQVVVVLFWSPSCWLCRAEVGALAELSRELGDGLAIVGVVPEAEATGLEDYLEAAGIDWPNVFDRTLDGERISERLRVRGVQETILIDRNGSVVQRGLRGMELGDALRFRSFLSAEETEQPPGASRDAGGRGRPGGQPSLRRGSRR